MDGPPHVIRGLLRVVGALAVGLLVLNMAAEASAAGIISVHLCGDWTRGSNANGGTVGVAHSGSSGPGVGASYDCPPGGVANGIEAFTSGTNVRAGTRSYWEIDAPAGLSIVGARTVRFGSEGIASYGVNTGQGWGGGFYWKGGGASLNPSMFDYSSPLINSPYFGWQIVCGASTCDGVHKPAELGVLELQLAAMETVGPTVYVNPFSLGAAGGWVRGKWLIAFTADGPTGACQLSATLGGVSVSQAVNEPQNQISWHQCPNGLFAQTFDTASLGSGAGVPLVMWTRDAAYDYGTGQYNAAAVTRNVNIDNDPVSLSLAGPTDAPSTAGPQTITASATAGPSGVMGIWCSVDGSPYSFHAGAGEQIQLQGIGQHTASCYAANNAFDMSAQPARSPVQTWNLAIRAPTVSAVSFAHVVNALRCTKQRERVQIPARWVTVTYRGHRQRIKLPAETRTVTVVHCHPRVVRQRVLVHGRWRVRRVVLLPHTVRVSTKYVAHGAPATISGWLGTAAGAALAGQAVTILTAPDTGHDTFTAAATATSGADGSWTATLPAGPSRLVRAVYGGTATTEPAASTDARIVVPAAVSLNISPHHTHWGRTIKIRGRLHGGYVPPSGELVVLWIGWPGGSTEIGHLYARADGRFGSTYTFLRGNGSETYHLWAASAAETDYPFASARSRATQVQVSP